MKCPLQFVTSLIGIQTCFNNIVIINYNVGKKFVKSYIIKGEHWLQVGNADKPIDKYFNSKKVNENVIANNNVKGRLLFNEFKNAFFA